MEEEPYATVPIRGQVHHARARDRVRVLYREGERWRRFPLPATTNSAGRFTAYVELGRPGTYALRVVHVPSGARSPVLTVRIG